MKFIELLQEYRIDNRPSGTHHHVTQGWLGIDCPWCSPRSGRFRMGYNLAKGFVTCWTCGGHNLLKTLEEITGENPYKLRQLLDGLDVHINRETTKTRGKLVIPKGVGPLLKQHRAYLKWRGFDPDEISEIWGVKGIGIAPKLSWHLWIPIHYEGKVVSWTCRSISREKGGRRYTNARPDQEEMAAKDVLYGMDLARTACIVVEGCTDVWAVGPGAVATMGINVTPSQITHLWNYPIRCICFDTEFEAQRRAKKLCDRLEIIPGTTMNATLDTGKDSASAKKSEIRELRDAVFC